VNETIRTNLNLTPQPERACEPTLGSDDGKWIFESIIGAVQKNLTAKAA